jgi:hypothetical protein
MALAASSKEEWSSARSTRARVKLALPRGTNVHSLSSP